MQRYDGIEGLRAWLAWCVVASHIVFYAGATAWLPGLYRPLQVLADTSVLVFIVISGFVICHLIVERHERYGVYILRRFLRIYPVYIVALLAGIGSTFLSFDTFLSPPWGSLSPPTVRLAREAQSLGSADLWRHLLAHLSLLHGAISNNLLYESEYMFLTPAWSLSLEWQFYLVAPLVISAAVHPIWRNVAAVLTVLGVALYEAGAFGSFFLPSVLPGAAYYFAAGIATRLLLGRQWNTTVFPAALLVLALGMARDAEFRPLFLWAVFVLAMLTAPNARDMLSRGVARGFRACFANPLIGRLGRWSFSTYMIHVPIIQIIAWVCVRGFGLGPQPTLWITAAVTIPVTLIASALLYRFVELPGIEWGRRLSLPRREGGTSVAPAGQRT